jgi:hypothetical protein
MSRGRSVESGSPELARGATSARFFPKAQPPTTVTGVVNMPFEMLFVPPPDRFSVAEKVPVAGVPPAPSAELIVKEQVSAKVGGRDRPAARSGGAINLVASGASAGDAMDGRRRAIMA